MEKDSLVQADEPSSYTLGHFLRGTGGRGESRGAISDCRGLS